MIWDSSGAFVTARQLKAAASSNSLRASRREAKEAAAYAWWRASSLEFDALRKAMIAPSSSAAFSRERPR
jgi:hypothetical protein